MVEAGKYFKDRGDNVGKKLEVQSVSTISADGQVMGISGIEGSHRCHPQHRRAAPVDRAMKTLT